MEIDLGSGIILHDHDDKCLINNKQNYLYLCNKIYITVVGQSVPDPTCQFFCETFINF